MVLAHKDMATMMNPIRLAVGFRIFMAFRTGRKQKAATSRRTPEGSTDDADPASRGSAVGFPPRVCDTGLCFRDGCDRLCARRQTDSEDPLLSLPRAVEGEIQVAARYEGDGAQGW